ncbi:hypothetical protein LCGC14_1872900 [marine sediment metagenome]|uniref:Uncharacterized protein n=2 Tax=root TaxID=1 RepID=A0A0F9GSJ5_9ZZZZ|nr:MAG: hypothetical protein LCMAC202_05990 [Marseillevirus LCMAC202]
MSTKTPKDIGKVFINRNCYRAPDIYRIVGRTAKRVIVEKVLGKNKYDLYGGEHWVDMEWLEKNPPVYVTKGGVKAIQKEDNSLLIDGEYYFEEKDPYKFHCQSVEY